MSTLGFVPAAPYVVPVAKAAISAVTRVYASGIAAEFLWRRFRPRDRNPARALIESRLGPLPADVPDLANGGGDILYDCSWGWSLTRDGQVQGGYPMYSSVRVFRGPLNLYFESVDGGSRWRLAYSGTMSPRSLCGTTRKIEDGYFMNLLGFSAVPQDPLEADRDLENEGSTPRRPTPAILAEAATQGISRTPGGTFRVTEQPPDGFPPVTFELGSPEFDGQRLRQPMRIPKVRLGDKRSASPEIQVEFDFTPNGRRTPITGSSGTRTPAPTIRNPNPIPQTIPTPVQTERRSRPPEYSPAPGIEVRFDWTPPDIARILTPPELDDPPPFPEWIPELLEELDWQPDPSPRTTVTTDKCPDPCPAIPPSICQYDGGGNNGDDEEEPEPEPPHYTYVDGAQVILEPHPLLTHITEIYLSGENLFVPRLATARWVTADGSLSPDIDIKSRITYLVPPSPLFVLLQVHPYGDTGIVQVRRKFRTEKKDSPTLYFWEDEDNPYDAEE